MLVLCVQYESKSKSCLVMSYSLWHFGILKARILEWVAIPSSKESSQLKDRTKVSCIASGFFIN